MGYSAKIKIDNGRPKKDGTASIFMQVIIDRKKSRIDLGIAWPPHRFDEVNLCRTRKRPDPDMDEYNVIINNARAKANTIHKTYLIRGIHINLEAFLREYRSNLNKNDFIEYYAQKSFHRWNKREISDQTYKNEKSSLVMLRSFATILPFHEFNSFWADKFDKHMKSKESGHNTRWGRHKNVSTYLNMARDVDNISFTDPYTRFNNNMIDGSYKPLALDQLLSLADRYFKWKLTPLNNFKAPDHRPTEDLREGLTWAEVIVLRRFLFMCNSSLRISDGMGMERSQFENFNMSLTPHKTEKYSTNVESVPLNEMAIEMLKDELADNKSPFLFNRYCDQFSNRILKRIAKKVGLNHRLHHHVARSTFASLWDQAGGNHTALMKYMGLRKRETLNKYVHTNQKRIALDVEKLNFLIGHK